MGSVSAAVGWTAEDDVLLKKAVEAGASLESLAKGAVCFSRKFTLEVLQDRCNGQYSFHKMHSDGSVLMDESLRSYLHADQLYGYDDMQKNSQTSGSFINTDKNRSNATEQFDNGAKGSKALPGIYQDQDSEKHGQFSGNNTGGLLEPGSTKAINRKWCSQEPSIPTWSMVLGVSSPYMLTDMRVVEPKTIMFSDDQNMKTSVSDAHAFQVNLDSVIPDSGLGSEMASECGFMHCKLKDFSKKEDLELVRGEPFQDSALDANQKYLGPHNFDITNCGNCIDLGRRKQNVADVSGVDTIAASSEVLYPEHNTKCVLNTEDSEIPFNDHILVPCQSSLEPTYFMDQDSQHDVDLVLAKLINLENAQPSSPSSPVNLEPAIVEKNTMVSLDEGCIIGNEPPGLHGDFGGNNVNMCISALHSIDRGEETACGFVKHEYCDNLHNVTSNKSSRGSDQMSDRFLSVKPKIGCETAIKSCELSDAFRDTEFDNPIETVSTLSQAEGSDSEGSVPNFFDLEALILDQDLIPWDQEPIIQPEVSRFQYPEKRKDLIRLEKGACSYMNRSIMFNGAFAVLYGQHLKCYIRDPEVTLGRQTKEVNVDIDLGKEGNANKISRRQAVIKMDDCGSFCIENTGKCSIFVDSKEVPCNRRMSLISDSLLEIRNMKFIFHVNHNAVKKYIARTRSGSSRGKFAAFDWNQNP
ncbi:hypothetical protein HU200_046397 [Digitaria exilis]|uniref:FHA domain-containing protein n=1 Tax=Digitaria exilis TaxID=1010633 RepID=A0A835AYG8_9POAL|nr:hypothetical protein HU200_046397 [Digitaria exilis]